MPLHGLCRKTTDIAGGPQLNTGQDFVLINDDGGVLREWVLLGDPVTPHGPGEHGSPVMAEGSSFVSINDIPVCREGHLASCGHPTTGSVSLFLED